MTNATPKRTRTQIADEIYIGAVVFVRKARKNGHANLVTKDLFYEIAQERGYGWDDFSIRTVMTIARRNMTSMGETEWIDF